MKIKLLHISDIHFNKNSGDSYDLDKALRYQVELDCQKLQAKLGDFAGILVTGDVSFSATEDQFEKAEIWLKNLCNLINCDPGNVWITPGNHDIDRSKYHESKLLRDVHSQIRSLNLKDFNLELVEILREEYYQKSIYSPLREYIDFAGRYSCSISPKNPVWIESNNRELKFPSGYNINLIGLNSVLGSNQFDDVKSNKLFIGEHQLQFDEAPNSINITLCHHPFDWLMDFESVSQTLSLKTHISLFGHKHEQWITPETPCETEHVCVTAGAVHPERVGSEWIPRFNALVLEIEENTNQFYLDCKIYSRLYSNEEKKFIPEFFETNEFKQFQIPLQNITEELKQEVDSITIGEVSTMKLEKDNDYTSDDLKKISTMTKKELNFRFLRIQYYEIVKIGVELGLMREEDRNGIKDYELTKRFIERAETSNLLDELTQKVIEIYEKL